MTDSSSKFCHLHLHTEYSLLDGAIRLDDLFEACRQFNMDSVAITDHGTMFGVAPFVEKAGKAGIKPVVGCEMYVAPRTIDKKTPIDKKGVSHLVLLAKNRTGYANLCKLASIAQLKGFYYRPRVDRELLAEFSEGLIAMSACLKGEIPGHIINDNFDAALKTSRFFLETFGEDNFFLEVQENGMTVQEKVNKGLFELSQAHGIPMVATNDCHYLSKEDKRAHEILLCIQTGDTLYNQDRFKFDSDQLYFKSGPEMVQAFGKFPGAIENTVEIAGRCNIEFDDKTYHFPRYAMDSTATEDELFRDRVYQGFEEKLAQIKKIDPAIDEKLYRSRLEYEIKVILDMGFPGYFLIVADFIDHSRKIGVPVGPGRGSAAGSMVAYALGITALDPIEHGLIFERFLNPSRISMPDIDVDFCIQGRDQVYKYVIDRYGGGEYVCQIITFGKMKARAVIRDVGRALGVPLAQVDEIAKLIPETAKNLKSAIQDVQLIKEKCSESDEKTLMLEASLLLEGLPRHASTHAAGVVISDKPLVEYLPLFKGKEGETLTQFDMNYVEKIGLVKFDFLGLRNLTVIKNCLDLIREQHETVPDLENIGLDDKKTFELLQHADTTGVFQLESSGMKDLISRLKPADFSDIVALVALYRPGPLDSGMADTYVERKHGRESVTYLFPELEDILKETYGVILYQEQVMKIAVALASYTMADADGLRKAMGKKKVDMMQTHRELFLAGAQKNNLDPDKARQVFDLMEKFGGYGFNKSHSAAYALISYQTAFLKANYTLEFFAALMTSEMNNTDSVIKYMEECRSHDIRVLPPDINESDVKFTVDKNNIRFALAAVKNVGEAAIESIIEARNENGRFSSIYDFCENVNLWKVNKKVVESLIKCGAFDSTGAARSQMMAVMEDALEHGARIQREKADNQMDLFADSDLGAAVPASIPKLPAIDEWEENELLAMEKETLGFYMSGHPLNRYESIIQTYSDVTSVTVQEASDGKVIRIGGVIKPLKLHKTKKGDMMAFAMVEDMTGHIEVVVFPNLYVAVNDLLAQEAIVICEAQVQKTESSVKLIAEKIIPIDNAAMEWTKSCIIHIESDPVGEKDPEDLLSELKQIFLAHKGECVTCLNIRQADGSAVMVQLSDDYKVACTRSFVRKVKKAAGPDSIETTCAPVRQKPDKKKWGRSKKSR